MELTYVDLVNQANPDFVIACSSNLSKKRLSDHLLNRSPMLLKTHNNDTLIVSEPMYKQFVFVIIADENVKTPE
jgi:hypothetical protein